MCTLRNNLYAYEWNKTAFGNIYDHHIHTCCLGSSSSVFRQTLRV